MDGFSSKLHLDASQLFSVSSKSNCNFPYYFLNKAEHQSLLLKDNNKRDLFCLLLRYMSLALVVLQTNKMHGLSLAAFDIETRKAQ